MAAGIELEVISTKGQLLHETRLDEVVLRRREPDHDPGSEFAILRSHGPELLATCAHRLRYRRGTSVTEFPVDAGIAEVLDDRVTLLITGVQ